MDGDVVVIATWLSMKGKNQYVVGNRMHEFYGETLKEASNKALSTVKKWLRELNCNNKFGVIK